MIAKLEITLSTAKHMRRLICGFAGRTYRHFQQYGILTSVDSDEPVQPAFKGLVNLQKHFRNSS